MNHKFYSITLMLLYCMPWPYYHTVYLNENMYIHMYIRTYLLWLMIHHFWGGVSFLICSEVNMFFCFLNKPSFFFFFFFVFVSVILLLICVTCSQDGRSYYSSVIRNFFYTSVFLLFFFIYFLNDGGGL